MDRLKAAQVFVEVVERGSLTAAAEALGLSRAMASRHLEAVEQWLGARLLQRSTRRLSLTDAGAEALPRCRQLVELAEEVQSAASARQHSVRGRLRVAVSMSFAQQHLAPAVAEFLARYPLTQIEVLVSEHTVNLVEERIDLALRISNQLDPALIARRLTVCRSVLCASPAYLRDRPAPTHPADLLEHVCVAHARFGGEAWALRNSRGERLLQPVPPPRLVANEALLLRQAVLAGAGIGLLPTYLVGPALAAGELVRVLPDWEPEQLGIHAVYTSRRHQPLLLRSFVDFLAERFESPRPYWDDMASA